MFRANIVPRPVNNQTGRGEEERERGGGEGGRELKSKRERRGERGRERVGEKGER